MRRFYPYLVDPYYETLVDERDKIQILSLLDDAINQKEYVRVTLLNWEEEPIKEIQGELTAGGSFTKDGNSPIRCSGSFTCSIDTQEYSITSIESEFAINKKIFLEMGVKNTTGFYEEFPVLWFPQGVFYIADVSLTANATAAITLTIQYKDKMAGLNGDIGGNFPTTVQLNPIDDIGVDGNYHPRQILIYDLIMELVAHFAAETQANIVVDDVPLKAKQLVKWGGDKSNAHLVYNNGEFTIRTENIGEFEQVEPNGNFIREVKQNELLGYIYTDLVYPGELTAGPGETITSVLDKIVSALGGIHEYYYDAFGIFHFRQKRTYEYTTLATKVLEEVEKGASIGYEDYVVLPESIYSFTDNKNIITINNQPQYGQIKNDYTILSQPKDSNRVLIYHLVIDEKPELQTHSNLILYERDGLKVLGSPIAKTDVGLFNALYKDGDKYYYWGVETTKSTPQYYEAKVVAEYPTYQCKDWRTELYVQAVEDAVFGLTSSYYAAELLAYWPQIYDLEKQEFYDLDNLPYFLDFIDPRESQLGDFSVRNIGRRTYVEKKDELNVIFIPNIPDIVFYEKNEEDINENLLYYRLHSEYQVETSSDIYQHIKNSGQLNDMFSRMEMLLYEHTSYPMTISITCRPIYYLEPNSRIQISDDQTQAYEDCIAKSISFSSLGTGGTMTVNAYKVTNLL